MSLECKEDIGFKSARIYTVSYTHLDVYKRQELLYETGLSGLCPQY